MSQPEDKNTEWLYSELFATRERLKATLEKCAEYRRKAEKAKKEVALAKETLSSIKSSFWFRLASPLRRIERYFTRRVASNSPPPSSNDRPPKVATVALSPSSKEGDASPSLIPSAVSQEGDGTQDRPANLYWEIQQKQALAAFLENGCRLRFSPPEQPVISVILVLYNRAELTLGCLASLAAWGGNALEIVILDNNSTDQTPLLLDRLDGVKIIRSTENLHYLKGTNLAAGQANGEFLLLLNNDTSVLPGAISAALKTIQSTPDAGAVGGRILFADGTLQEAGSIIFSDGGCLGFGRGQDPDRPEFRHQRAVDYCSAAFLLTRRTTFSDLGGFDERFSPAYYEETDYCMRLADSGLRTYYEPNAAILHFEFASSVASSHALLLQERNRGIFRDTHATRLAEHPNSRMAPLLAARRVPSGPRVLYIEDRIPHVFLGAGYPRSNAIVRVLVESGCRLTLYPLAFPSEDYATSFADIPPTVEVAGGLRKSGFPGFLQSRSGMYQFILVSRPHNAEWLFSVRRANPELFEGLPIVYDAEAVFSDRSREASRISLTQDSNWEEEFRREMALAAEADSIISVSCEDGERFRQNTGRPVHVVGHRLDVCPGEPGHAERSTVLFVGAVHEENTPNADSLRWFFTEIFPLLANSGIRFEIAGFCAIPSMIPVHRQVIHLGMVSDLTPAYTRARVFIAPTRYAAGLPMKVHEAASAGVPVVATPLLVRQLGWRDERDILAASTPEDFARGIGRLWSDEALWKGVREAALERIREDCGREKFAQGLADTIKLFENKRLLSDHSNQKDKSCET